MNYQVPGLWLLIFLFLFLAVIGFALFFLGKWFSRYRTDLILMIDKNNRFSLIPTDLRYRNDITIRNCKYFLHPKAGLVSKSGKALYILAENKTAPLQVNYDKAEWIDAKSLMSMINNEVIKLLTKTTSGLDSFLMLGAIAAMIAAIAGILTALKVLGVLH